MPFIKSLRQCLHPIWTLSRERQTNLPFKSSGQTYVPILVTIFPMPGALFTKKTPSYMYRHSHYKAEMVWWPYYLQWESLYQYEDVFLVNRGSDVLGHLNHKELECCCCSWQQLSSVSPPGHTKVNLLPRPMTYELGKIVNSWQYHYQYVCAKYDNNPSNAFLDIAFAWFIWVRSRNCGCLVTWFCYQLIAKPGNKTASVSWPDPYDRWQEVDCGQWTVSVFDMNPW